MKPFLDDDFLLETETAVELYHQHAAPQPIIDYHCHLPPDWIASNHQFATLSEIWLEGDHYKWRAMRAAGVPERLITGDGSPWEKFEAWARTVPQTLRNPLYHWTHLELKFPFGVKGTRLGPDTARDVYDRCNALLATPQFRAQGLLRQYKVRVVCTTDDPVDSLEHHRAHGRDGKAFTRLLPTWRPDRALAIADPQPWNEWVDRLEVASGVATGDLAGFREALRRRHDHFHESGCRSSDHGLDRMPDAEYTEAELRATFSRARAGKLVSPEDAEKFRTAMLHEMALLDHARGWVQQFHLGALRNNNSRARRTLGPDTGFDSIGDLPQAASLSRFLDRLDGTDRLARTILYNLNPADNEVFATMVGNFQDGTVPGKLQYGSAWWFLDQLEGMERQIDALSNMGLLSRFIGMLTDSRSFLSYSRHEYFRRLLCNMLGRDVERGRLPDDRALLGQLVEDVCFHNVRRYFGFEVGAA